MRPGLEIECHRAERRIWLSQPKYASSALVKFGMDNCHPVSTAMQECKIFEFKDYSSTELCEDHTMYPCHNRKAIGFLMYLVIGTRPDFSFANCKMSQFCECPTSMQRSALKRIFRFIKVSLKLGICFHGSEPLKIHRFRDSDWLETWKIADPAVLFSFKLLEEL